MKSLEELEFHNTYNELGLNFQSPWLPEKAEEPEVVFVSTDVARLLDLDASECTRPEFVEFVSGNRLWPTSKPLVSLYAGHRGAELDKRLGDGRFILVGEVRADSGTKWDLGLKGGGPTPHSRGRDGCLGVGEAVRELILGETLDALGVPATRTLAIVRTGGEVERDGVREPAVRLFRLASTHVRFGTFQYFYHLLQPGWVRNLANHTIRTLDPDIPLDDDRFVALTARVVRRTAELAAAWRAVGFAHGAFHTDNASVAGVTLDPKWGGFVEALDPDFAPDPNDSEGRFRFGSQADIAKWNLKRFAESFLDFVKPDAAMAEIDRFDDAYAAASRTRFRRKLGLESAEDSVVDELVVSLESTLASARIDWTTFFHELARFRPNQGMREGGALDPWLESYERALSAEKRSDEARVAAMGRVNPEFVPRRAAIDSAIARARAGDWSEVAEVVRRGRGIAGVGAASG